MKVIDEKAGEIKEVFDKAFDEGIMAQEKYFSLCDDLTFLKENAENYFLSMGKTEIKKDDPGSY